MDAATPNNAQPRPPEPGPTAPAEREAAPTGTASPGKAKPAKRRKNRAARWVPYVAAALLLAAGTFWAGTVVGKQQAIPDEATQDPVFVEVSEQSVGRTYMLGVIVNQQRTPVSANLLTGVLTSVAEDGQFSVGDVVYTVDGTPVRVMQGSQPFFRDLYEGATGTDVRQLNDALVGLGYLAETGDKFTWLTTVAINNWQKDTGRPQTGMVGRGELLAVGSLPAQLIVDDEKFAVGSLIAEGDPMVLAPSSTPEFLMPVTPMQLQAIPLGAPLQVQFGSVVWDAVVADSKDDMSGGTNLVVTAPDGGVVCGDQCGELPPAEFTTLLGSVEVVPKTTGPAVPIAALQIQPSGQIVVMVREDDGQSGGESTPGLVERVVEVLASQDGIAIISGVNVGEQVLLFAPGDAAGNTVGPSQPVGGDDSDEGADEDADPQSD